MASTRRPNLAVDPKQLTRQIQIQQEQLQTSLDQYKHKFGEYPLRLVNPVQQEQEKIKEEKERYEYINDPAHYQQEDGKSTWERMVDKWGEEKTALWCEMTAFKYQDRMGKKPGEDIEREKGKIEWYENKAKELRELAKKKKFW